MNDFWSQEKPDAFPEGAMCANKQTLIHLPLVHYVQNTISQNVTDPIE